MNAFAFTAVGPRPNNEDTVLVDQDVFTLSAKEERPNASLLAVFDGVGGSPRGEEASLAAAKSLAASYSPEMDLPAFRLALYQAHVAVRALGTPGAMANSNPLTTMVGLAKLKDRYYGFNLGDSIGLIYSQGKLRQISYDDSTAPNLYPLGLSLHSYITYCLGQPNLIPEDLHLYEVSLEKGDTVLITSDGITNAIPFKDLEDLLGATFDAKERFESILSEIDIRGTKDNYSLVLAEIE